MRMRNGKHDTQQKTVALTVTESNQWESTLPSLTPISFPLVCSASQDRNIQLIGSTGIRARTIRKECTGIRHRAHGANIEPCLTTIRYNRS